MESIKLIKICPDFRRHQTNVVFACIEANIEVYGMYCMLYRPTNTHTFHQFIHIFSFSVTHTCTDRALFLRMRSTCVEANGKVDVHAILCKWMHPYIWEPQKACDWIRHRQQFFFKHGRRKNVSDCLENGFAIKIFFTDQKSEPLTILLEIHAGKAWFHWITVENLRIEWMWKKKN